MWDLIDRSHLFPTKNLKTDDGKNQRSDSPPFGWAYEVEDTAEEDCGNAAVGVAVDEDESWKHDESSLSLSHLLLLVVDEMMVVALDVLYRQTPWNSGSLDE